MWESKKWSHFFLCHKVCLWQKWDKNLVFLSPKLLSLSGILLSPSMPTAVSNIISVVVGGEGQGGPRGSCPLLLPYPRIPSRMSVTEWLFKVSLESRSLSLLQAVWFKPYYQSPNNQTPLIGFKHCPRQRCFTEQCGDPNVEVYTRTTSTGEVEAGGTGNWKPDSANIGGFETSVD